MVKFNKLPPTICLSWVTASIHSSDPGTAYNIVLTISRLIYAVQVFLTLLGLVAVCTSGYGLLVPWFFFTNVQLLQHISLFVYAIVKERYVVSGYAVAVVLGLVLTYLVALKYYKAMRMEERRRFSVAAAPSTSSVPPPPPQPAQPVFSP